MEFITDPLQFSFFQRALLAAILVGILCPMLGTFVVLRGMAFLGDALAHIILPGVVVAFLLGIPIIFGALVMGIITAIGIGVISERAALREDSTIGVIFAGSFALGIVLLSATDGYAVDLTHFLFGNLLGVSWFDLGVMGVISLIVITIIVVFFKELRAISFDPTLARTLKLPVRLFDYGLLVLIALTIVVALEGVGVSLMLAMLVTPSATATFFTNRLQTMMLVSAGIGVFSGIFGLYASFYFDVASGPAVVLTATLIFAIGFFIKNVRQRKPLTYQAT